EEFDRDLREVLVELALRTSRVDIEVLAEALQSLGSVDVLEREGKVCDQVVERTLDNLTLSDLGADRTESRHTKNAVFVNAVDRVQEAVATSARSRNRDSPVLVHDGLLATTAREQVHSESKGVSHLVRRRNVARHVLD